MGVSLRNNEQKALGAGLTVTEGLDRKIYVATTRARYRTIEVFRVTPALQKRGAHRTTTPGRRLPDQNEPISTGLKRMLRPGRYGVG